MHTSKRIFRILTALILATMLLPWNSGSLSGTARAACPVTAENWHEVGTDSACVGGISNNSGDSGWTSLAIAPDGTPYVAWYDGSGGDYEIYVRRWEGDIWTLMFYLDGDNNLDSTYVAVFNQLESAADNPDGNILVAWDRSANGNSAYYEVQHDTDLDEAEPAADYTNNVNRWPKNELRMNDSSTLSDFIQWARTNYPAQHYALVISDHGTGLGVSPQMPGVEAIG